MALIGSGTQQDPYLISTVDDLYQMSNGTSTVYKHFKMTNDITLPSRNSNFPLSSRAYIVFDGDGHKFTGLEFYESRYNSSSYEGWGIWDYLAHSTIKNVGAEGFIFTTYAVVGAFVGETYGNVTFENCFVRNSLIRAYATGGADYWKEYGGFVGEHAGGTLTFNNCFVSTLWYGGNQPITGTSYTGGFVGYGRATFNNCYFIGGVSSSKTSDEGSFVSTPFRSGGTALNNCYEVNMTGQTSQATVITQEQLKNPTTLVGWDFANTWGINPDFNDGYPMQKVFLPQEIPAVIEQRTVAFDVNALSMTAVSKMITPFIKSLNVEFNVQPIDTNVEALAKLYTPFVKKLEVTHFVNPISISAYSKLIRIIRKQIEVIHSINPIDVEGKRLQLKKSIGEIVHYMNNIAIDTVTIANLAPVTFDNLARLLESGNEVKVIEHIINNVYVNESQHSIHNLQSKSEVTALAFTGDTVTLQVAFKAYDNVAIEPTDVVLKIYKQTLTTNQLVSEISLSEDNKTGIGKYECLYTIPTNITDSNILVAEFSGKYNGQTTLVREQFPIRFV